MFQAIRRLPGLRAIRVSYLGYVYHPLVIKLSVSVAALGLLIVIASQHEGRASLIGIHHVLRDQFVWSVLLLALLFAVSTISPFVPEYMVTVAAGFVFGVLFGSIFAVVAITLAASGNFLIARHYGRRVIHFLFDAHSAREIRWTASRVSPAMVFFIWLLPSINFDLVSYAAGLSKMRYQTFVALTITGTFFSSILLSFLGAQVRSDSAVKGAATLMLYTLIGIALYVRELPPRFKGMELRAQDSPYHESG
jgi:uncharacterized membrane protein YdjX (TVP38/TMEM64 family)